MVFEPYNYYFYRINFTQYYLQIIINFIIYIEGSMGIFIIYIGIIGPLSHLDCIDFKGSLVIKIINFNGISNLAYLVMLVIFHMNMIICQIFNFPHIYPIFAEKKSFFKLVTGYPNMIRFYEMTWFNIPSTFIKIINHLIFFGVLLCFQVHI